MTTIITKTKQDWQQLRKLVEDRSKTYVITVEEYGKKRTVDQNAGKEKLYMDAARMLGESKVYVMSYCKYNFGLAILWQRNDEDIEKQMLDAFLRKVEFKSLPMDEKLKLCEKLPVTGLMKVSELTSYIRLIIEHYNSVGIYLSLQRG